MRLSQLQHCRFHILETLQSQVNPTSDASETLGGREGKNRCTVLHWKRRNLESYLVILARTARLAGTQSQISRSSNLEHGFKSLKRACQSQTYQPIPTNNESHVNTGYFLKYLSIITHSEYTYISIVHSQNYP